MKSFDELSLAEKLDYVVKLVEKVRLLVVDTETGVVKTSYPPSETI